MNYYGDIEEVIMQNKRMLKYKRCDCCKKKIRENDLYYDVETSHNDWGNDSIDSLKFYDICVDCIKTFMMDYLHDNIRCRSDKVTAEKVCLTLSHWNSYDMYEDRLVVDDDNVEGS